MNNIELDNMNEIKQFDIEFLEPYKEKKINALAKIGNDCYTVPFKCAAHNFDSIRTHLEDIILNYRNFGQVEFTSMFNKAITVRLKGITLPDKQEVTEVSVTYENKEEEGKASEMYFCCKLEQVIGAIYKALLFLAQTNKDYEVELYNKIQSWIIEDYLVGKYVEIHITKKRSRYNGDINKICKDYASVIKNIYTPDNLHESEELKNIAKEFLKNAHSIRYTQTNDLSNLLLSLKHIKLKKGYTLNHFSIGDRGVFVYTNEPGTWYGNFNTYVGVKETATGKIHHKDLYRFFEYEFCGQALWELYLLLEHTVYLLPKGWHGGYMDHQLILGNEEIEDINPDMNMNSLWKISVLERYEDHPLIPPHIKIMSKDTAILNVTKFTKWGGLIQHRIVITNRAGQLRFCHIGIITLKYYNCGIMF